MLSFVKSASLLTMLCALSSIFSVLHSSAQKSCLLHEASLWLFKGNHKEGSWRRHKEVFPLLNLVVISVSLLGLPLVGFICILGLLLLFSCPVMSDSSRPHGLQHSRPLCPSPSPEFAQVHVHCISDAVHPSHSLTPSSPSALNLSQHHRLFQWVGFSYQVTKIRRPN